MKVDKTEFRCKTIYMWINFTNLLFVGRAIVVVLLNNSVVVDLGVVVVVDLGVVVVVDLGVVVLDISIVDALVSSVTTKQSLQICFQIIANLGNWKRPEIRNPWYCRRYKTQAITFTCRL